MTTLGLFSQLSPKPDEDAALFVGFDVHEKIAYLAVYKKAPPEGHTSKKPTVLMKLTLEQREAISKVLAVDEEEEAE